ncbi:MAG: GAF domain-containing protein [Proteobacteria bacterium]|nr:GAF domain-containing protein [Pseudomonadota bacterium]MDA1299230.1 GAF domain-containing protein [Pseudomonadota bacterium]
MSSSTETAGLKLDQDTAEEKLLDFYVRIMPILMQCERCGIFVASEKDGFVWLKAGTGQRERSIEVEIVENSIVGRVMESGNMIFEDRLDKMPGKHKYFDRQTGFETHDVLCVPVKSLDGNRLLGAVQLLNHVGGGEYHEDEIGFLEDLLEYLAFAMDNPEVKEHTGNAPSAGPWKGIAIAAMIGCALLAIPAALFVLS